MRATVIRISALSHAQPAFQSHRWDEVERIAAVRESGYRGKRDRGWTANGNDFVGRVAVAGRLLYVGHATVLIELDGVRLLTDPVLRPRIWHLTRRVALDRAELERIDAALVSHVH